MRRIAFPTDFSDASRNALRYAIEFAKDWDAKVDILTVYHIPMVDVSHTPPELIHRMTDEKREETELNMEAMSKEFACDQVGDCHCIYGVFIAQELNEYVKDNNYDLIIMGTRSEHGRLDRLFGSVSTQTMMNANVPVLAIPADAVYRPIKSIAYATDFRPEDGPYVGQLMELAGKLQANVHFVHVETHPEIGEMNGEVTVADHPLPFADFSIINSHTVTEGLDKYVKEHEVDVMALFIPKRRLWERLFHSSVSRKMTFQTDIPLLVFHQSRK